MRNLCKFSRNNENFEQLVASPNNLRKQHCNKNSNKGYILSPLHTFSRGVSLTMSPRGNPGNKNVQLRYRACCGSFLIVN